MGANPYIPNGIWVLLWARIRGVFLAIQGGLSID